MLRTIVASNDGDAHAYGADPWTERATGDLVEPNPLRNVGLALFGAKGRRVGEAQARSRDVEPAHITAAEILGYDLRSAELVVLSGCGTGLGDLADFEGVLGLQRAFLLSGAAAIVMSFWAVDDAATFRLMTEFYGRLRNGDSRLTALNEAKRQLAGTEMFGNPRYWAGFVLQGDSGHLSSTVARFVSTG